MIRLVQINRQVDNETGLPGEATCEVLLITSNRDINNATFRLTNEELYEASKLAAKIEARLGTMVVAHSTPREPTGVEHATKPDEYCPACREYRCLLLAPSALAITQGGSDE